MKLTTLIFSALAVLSAVPLTAQPAGPNADIVKATLLADTTAIKPDTTFTLGVLFKVQPGWHIYWRNPGSSGLATKVRWAMPEGSSVSDTLYPAPWAFTAPGDIVSYGYEDEILLMTEARLPASAKGEIELNAKASWLMCSDRCIPGKQDISLKLPVGDGQPANAELFAKYKKQLPKHVDGAPAGAKLTPGADGKVTVQIMVVAKAGEMLAAEDQHPDVRQVFFFPDNLDGAIIDTPKLSAPDGSVTIGGKMIKAYSKPATISYTLESGTAAPAPQRVAGVLVSQSFDSTGKSTGFEATEYDAAPAATKGSVRK